MKKWGNKLKNWILLFDCLFCLRIVPKQKIFRKKKHIHDGFISFHCKMSENKNIKKNRKQFDYYFAFRKLFYGFMPIEIAKFVSIKWKRWNSMKSRKNKLYFNFQPLNLISYTLNLHLQNISKSKKWLFNKFFSPKHTICKRQRKYSNRIFCFAFLR